MKPEELINERAKTHGSYPHTAHYAQRLKTIFNGTRGARTDIQNESLDLIATKLARILSGQADHIDHWADAAGYCQLVVDSLEIRNVNEP